MTIIEKYEQGRKINPKELYPELFRKRIEAIKANGKDPVDSFVARPDFLSENQIISESADFKCRGAAGIVVRSHSLVDNAVQLGGHIEIGRQVVIGPYSKIGSHTLIDDLARIASGARIGVDCYIGKQTRISKSSIASRVFISGKVLVGSGSRIGYGARLQRGVKLFGGNSVERDSCLEENVELGYAATVGPNVTIAKGLRINRGAIVSVDKEARVLRPPMQFTYKEYICAEAGLNKIGVYTRSSNRVIIIEATSPDIKKHMKNIGAPTHVIRIVAFLAKVANKLTKVDPYCEYGHAAKGE